MSNQFKQVITSKTGEILHECLPLVVLANHSSELLGLQQNEEPVILAKNLSSYIKKQESLRKNLDESVVNKIRECIEEISTWDKVVLTNGDVIHGQIEGIEDLPLLINRNASLNYHLAPTTRNWLHNVIFGFTIEATSPENSSHSILFRTPESESITVRSPWLTTGETIPLLAVKQIIFGWKTPFYYDSEIVQNLSIKRGKMMDESNLIQKSEKIKIGDERIGRICKFFPYGILVELSKGVKGLIQINSLDMAREVFESFFKIDVQVRVRIVSFEHSRKIGLEFLELI